MGAAYAGGTDPDQDAMPPEQTVSEQTAKLVLRAMIDAAKADGRVDTAERQRIVAKVQESGADQRRRRSCSRNSSVRPIRTGSPPKPATRCVAAQVYAASLLAIKVDTPEERTYLQALAGKLGLEPAVVAQLHGALGAPPPA